ncbi:serine hydrolase [Microbacterium sp. Sa1CUA4]|uniref:Serine hydrolase n=1 Tax=Microbacterium gallinarum TaxID=2762209 RepID=A0ABR8X6M7_9MICO|nr:serine hydrolase [Microbacterium gallinarum]
MLLDALTDDPSIGLRWSACVLDAGSREVLAAHRPDRVLSTASIGKVLLLLELSRRFRTGALDPSTPVARGGETVADSGLWHVMEASSLAASDAAQLVGAVSDNLATNVLLDVVGLDAVADLAASLGLGRTALLDRVRDARGPQHPPALSHGSAAELASLVAAIDCGDAVAPDVSALVRDWLSLGTDLSMVASAFGLDPLAHRDVDRGVVLWNKTGTDSGVRADVGAVRSGDRAIAYAVLAEWESGADRSARDTVLDAMRETGRRLRSDLERDTSTGRPVPARPGL